MLSWAYRRLRSQAGFTLIEMMMALIVMSALTASFATIVTAMVEHSTEITDDSVNQTEARSAIDLLARDFRQSYVGDGTNGVEAITGTTITFDSPDRAVPFHLRRISYRISSGQLQRQVTMTTNTGGPPWTWGTAGPWTTVMATVVNSPVFVGYSDYPTGAQTTTASAVRAITYNFVVTSKAGRGKQYTYNGTSSIRSSK